MEKPVVVFMGDSLTEYMPAPKLKKVELHLAGYSGMGVDFLLRQAERVLSRYKPDMVWLCIGVNDIWYFNEPNVPQQWEEAYGQLCQQITASKAKLFASTLMPVENFGFGTGFDLALMRSMNEIIIRQAKLHGAAIVDSYQRFANEQGFLPAQSTDDGVHLTLETYRQWVPFICASLGIE